MPVLQTQPVVLYSNQHARVYALYLYYEYSQALKLRLLSFLYNISSQGSPWLPFLFKGFNNERSDAHIQPTGRRF
jgi:hypothetical protein